MRHHQDPNNGSGRAGDSVDDARYWHAQIDQIPAILWVVDLQTFRLKFISSYAEVLLGYPLRLWIDEPTFWEDHICPEDREATVARRAEAARASQPYDLEYRMIAADGRLLWMREYGRRVTDWHGARLVGWIADLSPAKSERWLRQIIDTIPQQIWSGPADGTLDFCNARCLSEFGLTLEESQGDGWQGTIHPEDRDRVLTAWHESVVRGTSYEQEERLRLTNGEYRWYLSRGVPIRDEHGRVVRWFGTNTDIACQKRAEDEARRSEQQWHAVFDNALVGVALMDSSYHFTAANAAYQKMVGYSFEELRSMTCMDLVCDADHSTYQALNSELSSGKGDRFEMETRQRRKDGDLVWMRVNGSVLQARSGEPMVLVAMIEDISERKRLHDDLERERNVLRHLVEITQRFIAKVDVLDVIDAVLAGLDDQGCFWKWASLYLPEPSTDRLRVYLNRGIRECLREGHTIPIEGTIAGRVYRSGQPLLFRGDELAAASTEYNGCPSLQEAVRARLLETGCALPLIEDGRVLGVLFLGTSAKRDVSAVEFDYWQQLAGFVAAAISKARRFSEMTSSHEKLVTAKGYIEEQIRASFDLLHIVGRSKALQDVLEQVSMVAPTDSAVLILGETGTGKELIARAIHDRGERRDQAFIKVDCSAIPATLLESELFGHEKGAFTGAVANRLGRFEVADKGTLFLDEVGDLPLELQAKLLRFLQERTIERLGSNRTLSLDVRIVAATNRNLDDMVATGAFRADLYYRLKVFPITIPALRERPEDIEPLVWHYVRKYAGRLKKKIDSIPACAMDIFKQYPWPGNVRELQHFMERSAILTSGNVLQAPLQELRQVIRHPPVTFSSAGRTMEDIERDSILQALRESNWVVGGPHGAARRLGLKRTTLASRMERLGVSRPR